MKQNYLNERFVVNDKLKEMEVPSSAVATEIVEIPINNGNEFKNRVINLFGPFNEQTISEIMKQCLKWEEEDAEILYKHSQQIRQLQDPTQLLKPIILNINSPGGEVHQLMGLVDLLESMDAPVITRGYGELCSCGFVLFCIGDERYIGKNASLMYHELSYGIWGKDSEVKNYHKNAEKLQKKLDRIINAKTGVKLKTLKAWREAVHDKWIEPKEAVELGIATDYLY